MVFCWLYFSYCNYASKYEISTSHDNVEKLTMSTLNQLYRSFQGERSNLVSKCQRLIILRKRSRYVRKLSFYNALNTKVLIFETSFIKTLSVLQICFSSQDWDWRILSKHKRQEKEQEKINFILGLFQWNQWKLIMASMYLNNQFMKFVTTITRGYSA